MKKPIITKALVLALTGVFMSSVLWAQGGGPPSPPAKATGKTKRNDLIVAWKAEITEPFIKRFTCRWISQGVIKTGRENLSSTSQWFGVLDYGGGNCDNRATLTINGVKYEITLR